MLCDFTQTTERDEKGEATFQCGKCGRFVYHCKSEAHKIYADCRTEYRKPLTLLEMAANAAKAAEKFAASGGETVSKECYEARMVVCRNCPQFQSFLTRCGACGCFLVLKARMATEKCPDGKW